MSRPRPSTATCANRAGNRAAKGLTLIELGFVIIILATIVAVALTFYNSVSRNKEVTDTVTDVANIRQAVSSYAAGLPLIGTIGTELDGTTPVTRQGPTWDQLWPLLPGRLSSRARNSTSTELSSANAWDSTYRLVVVANQPFYWDLVINNIPDGLCQRVREKLAASARGVPECAGDTGDETMTVSFRVGA